MGLFLMQMFIFGENNPDEKKELTIFARKDDPFCQVFEGATVKLNT